LGSTLIFWITIAITAGLILSPIFLVKALQKKRYITKLKAMKPAQLQLEMARLNSKVDGYRTSHALHALLSLFMLGFWVIPWILIAQSNASQRRQLEGLMGSIVESAGDSEAQIA
jgi:hypothetical protein